MAAPSLVDFRAEDICKMLIKKGIIIYEIPRKIGLKITSRSYSVAVPAKATSAGPMGGQIHHVIEGLRQSHSLNSRGEFFISHINPQNASRKNG
jgi:hypothetical protein